MMARSDRSTSIRRRLLVWLLFPTVAVLVVGAISDYLTALPPFRDAYDQALLDSALVVAAHVSPDEQGHLHLSLPPDAEAVLRADSRDAIYFRVASADATFLAGDEDLPVPSHVDANPFHSDSTYRGEPVRLVTYRTYAGNQQLLVTVGETTHKRAVMRARILTNALLADSVEFAVILGFIWLGVRLSLSPLRTVEEQIAQRSARDLAPLRTDRVPIEIRRIVDALNRLFALVREGASNQRKFLDNAAHQLRTPLTGIQAQLELMYADEVEPTRRLQLQRILAGTQRLSCTTHQLLTLARADEAAVPSLEFEEVDLTSIVEATIVDCLSLAEIAAVDLGADLQPATVGGVSWLLSEAFKSLASNAIAHTPAGGSVTLSCGTRNGVAYLEVVDTGVGIPLAERNRVFERFFRASNARGAGSGLGLAIVKEVADSHGAALTIESNPAGMGTLVTLTFDN